MEASSIPSESQEDDKIRLLRTEDTTSTSYSWTCYASIPLIGATIWTSMMLYFLFYYLRLPRLHGTLPRIGFAYATFPYISCVGAIRLPHFQGFCIAIAIINSTSFALDLYLTASIRTARRWRWAKAISSWISSVFLILLSYYSVNTSDQLHLDFTSIQIVGTGMARTFDGLQQITLLRKSPANPYIERPNVVKKVAAVIAGPSSLLAIIGIYGCRNALQTLNTHSTCHKLVTISAPAEWILSVSWVIYMLAIAMDLYYVDRVTEDFWLVQRGKARGIELFPADEARGGYRPLSRMDEDGRGPRYTGKRRVLAAAWFRL